MKIKTFEEYSLNESASGSIWDTHGEKLPSIFKKTIYRLPTQEELREFESFELTGSEIVKGFGYTMIGRGMRSNKNSSMIRSAIKSLCEMFPDNKEYKAALTEAKYGHTVQKMNESITDEEFLSAEIEKIKSINSFDALKEYAMYITMGFMMPLNPIDPIRSVLRDKIYEIKNRIEDESHIKMIDSYLINLEGDRKDFSIPDGAMC
jgi:hypothetical protein